MALYHADLDRFQAFRKEATRATGSKTYSGASFSVGGLERLSDAQGETAAREFFGR
ncbi:MAG: hypothetical protein NTV49_04125 [Kiritimatiellaeota bacterium]|nr:hypothetical protein [Kiritimatiellota bacterium]